ncbi:MAG TPA: hypothetical protein VGQ67_15115, partial [Candidatus Polarisedimenticolia bacterium]|nr:hypothetical protein [Candidatus Polarisedimenticolia bacterium]
MGEQHATSLAQAFRVLNEMKSSGLVEDYAIAGAMALVFWTEPVATFDLDVLIFMPGPGGAILSLDPLYRWAESRGYAAQAEHIVIEGVPVQFLPSHNALADEAIRQAVMLHYDNVDVRVVRPEYLVALYLEPGARTAKRRERAAALLESDQLDRPHLD